MIFMLAVTRLRQQMFSPKQVMEDFLDQLEKGMGRGYDSFMSFAWTCDPKKALNLNQTDIHMAKITSNARMEEQIEQVKLKKKKWSPDGRLSRSHRTVSCIRNALFRRFFSAFRCLATPAVRRHGVSPVWVATRRKSGRVD